jgi:hypothetical protein
VPKHFDTESERDGLLTEEQEDNCVIVYHDLQEKLQRDPQFLLKVITGYGI